MCVVKIGLDEIADFHIDSLPPPLQENTKSPTTLWHTY